MLATLVGPSSSKSLKRYLMGVVRSSCVCEICETINTMRVQVGIDGIHKYAFPCSKCESEIWFEFLVDTKGKWPKAYPSKITGASMSEGDVGPLDGGVFFCSTHLVPKGGGLFSPFMTTMTSVANRNAYQFIGRARKLLELNNDFIRLDSFLIRKEWNLFSICVKKTQGVICLPEEPDCIFHMIKMCDIRARCFCFNGASRWELLWNQVKDKINRVDSDELASYYREEDRLTRLWQQIHAIRKGWAAVFEMISPIYFTYTWNGEWKNMELSQKRFSELKSFYIDCYEALCRISVIAGVFESLDVGAGYCVPKAQEKSSIFDFDRMANGGKRKSIERWHCAARFKSCSDSELRNAVGHHNAIYNVKTDVIACRNINYDGKVFDFEINYTEFCRKVCDIYQEVEVASLYLFALRLRSADQVAN